ncbi:unnamed protein product [Victoria cruziana]
MTDMETLQQKQGPSELIESPDACEEFRRGFEELVRDHLDSRMSLASCSGESGSSVRCGRCCRRCFDDELQYESVDIRRLQDDMLEDEDDEGDQLVRRRRRSDLEGDDVAESSAARRRYSRILTRWAARQAQDMITTIERHNREMELMALSRLHAVSMLDSSFLRESTASRGQAAVERPSTGASLIRQRWRELEDESTISRARNRANSGHSDTDSARYRSTGSVSPPTHGNEESHGALSRTNMSLRQASVQRGNSEVESVVSEETRWLDGDHNATEVARAGSESDYGIWSHGHEDSHNDDDGNQTSSREPSPDLGEGERERVREIFRGWMMENANESTMSRRSSPRAELLGETERERVRLVREWVHMASQQRDARGNRRHHTLESAVGTNSLQRQATGREEAVQGGLAGDGGERQPEHIRRDLLRLRGRQALLDLMVRIEEERQRELQLLLEHRAVSDFAHRNRIQSLLRGRFLRSGRSEDEERPPSLAARELGQLRQRQRVSGLRFQNIVQNQASNYTAAASDSVNVSGAEQLAPTSVVLDAVQNESQSRFHESVGDQVSGHTETIEGNMPTVNSQEQNLQEGPSEDISRDWQESRELRVIERQNSVAEEPDGSWQNESQNQVQIDEVENRDDRLQEHGRWNDASPQVSVDNWHEQHGNVSRMQRTSIRRINGFQPPDDDSVYSMELRELLSRRSVSNLLRSGFRESLDQLIQSYLQRQTQAPVDWDLQALGHHEASVEQTQDQLGEGGQTEDQPNPNIRPLVTLPAPPVPPPQPLWHRGLQATGWSRQSLRRSDMEWEIINDLRADMARLQQGMNHMQRVLEACMDMQLELQRSIRQEVSAALNRDDEGKGSGEGSSLDGARWGNVQKGLCCVCCDNNIDSLLYRCVPSLVFFLDPELLISA